MTVTCLSLGSYWYGFPLLMNTALGVFLPTLVWGWKVTSGTNNGSPPVRSQQTFKNKQSSYEYYARKVGQRVRVGTSMLSLMFRKMMKIIAIIGIAFAIIVVGVGYDPVSYTHLTLPTILLV